MSLLRLMKRHYIIYGMAPWLGAIENMEWGLVVESFLVKLKKIETQKTQHISQPLCQL